MCKKVDMRKDEFIDREAELKLLNALHKKTSSSLVVLKGRRRIGKSRLADEFAKGKKFLSFAGIPPTLDMDAQSQRDIFVQQLESQIGLNGIRSEDWSSLFTLLARHCSQGRYIILFDEISWMGSKDRLFLGKLKNAWDLEFKKNPELILIFCGSVSTWIEENILSSTAFFGRISLALALKELPLESCYKFLMARGFKGSRLEVFKLLSIAGGVPWYLEQVQSNLTADDNIKELCYRPEGVLFNEFDRIFHDLFEKRGSIYKPIVIALANGAMEFNALCDALKISKTGTLSKYLEDLIECGFVTRDYTWWIKSGKPSKLSKFRLSDNYLRYYLKNIEPNRAKIQRGGYENIDIAHLPGYSSVMGLQFENLVLKNRRKIWEKLGVKPNNIIADNPYFQKKSSTRKGCQIDYLIQTRFNTLFAIEMKFSINPIKSSVIQEMKEKLNAIELPKRFSIWPILIHVNGVSDEVINSGYFAEIIDFSDFLKT